MACLRIAERSGDSAGSPLSKAVPTPKPSPIPPGMPCIRMAAPTSYLGTSCPPSAPSVAPCSSGEYHAHDLPVIDEKNVTLCCEGTDSSVLSCNRNGNWQPLHSIIRNVSVYRWSLLLYRNRRWKCKHEQLQGNTKKRKTEEGTGRWNAIEDPA